MDKAELIGLTLDRLIEHFRDQPESFEYKGSESSSGVSGIFWQPKIQSNDSVVRDPNNHHAVVINWNGMNNTMMCCILLKAPANLSASNSPQVADCVVTVHRWFEKWRGNYRKFCKLRKLIVEREVYLENRGFLSKLTAVFPDSMDEHIR
jgi:hypothetical protein